MSKKKQLNKYLHKMAPAIYSQWLTNPSSLRDYIIDCYRILEEINKVKKKGKKKYEKPQ